MSDISIEEFYDDLKDQINLNSDVNSSPKEMQFLTWALDKLVELGDVDQYELIDDARDSNDRYRADAYTQENESDLATGMLGIVISIFDQSDSPENLTKTEIEKFLKKLQTFVNNSLTKDIDDMFEYGAGAHTLSNKIQNLLNKENPKIRFYIISNKPISSRINGLEETRIKDIVVGTHIWDLNRFYQFEMQGKEKVDTDVDLTHSPIKALQASNDDKDLKIYLAVLPGQILYDIFNKWGSRLLEQNVRSFLGAKTAANKGMRETVRSSPEKFIAFNNGLSATAQDIVLNERGEIVHLKNFQIVNGGQTSSTIFAAGKDKIALDNIYVQMKLVVTQVNDEDSSTLIRKISEYSNTQSKVQSSDFFSHHDFHKVFHEMSTRIIAPPKPNTVNQTKWFYERLKKQYLNEKTHLTSAEKNKFEKEYPKNQLLTKTELGKFIITFEAQPNAVAKGGEFNFKLFRGYIDKIWETNKSDINEYFFKNTIAKAIVWNKMFKHFALQKKTSPSKIGIYAIATLIHKINTENKFLNFEAIWKLQDCPDNLLKLLDDIGQKIYQIATSEDRPVDNIDSYFKSDKLWSLVKDRVKDIDLSRISNLFTELDKIKDDKLDARKDQRLTSEIEIEIAIKSVVKVEWLRIKDFLVAHGVDSPKKMGLIDAAIKSSHTLSAAQCKSIYNEFYAEYKEISL